MSDARLASTKEILAELRKHRLEPGVLLCSNRPTHGPATQGRLCSYCWIDEQDRTPVAQHDPVLMDLQDFWGYRERLLRTLRRWDGPAIAYDLFEALDVGHRTTESNAAQKALERLVADGLVHRHRYVSHSRTTGYFDPHADGARFQYVAAPWNRPRRGYFEAIRVGAPS